MKRLSYFNLLGVICLVGLCVAQWCRDRELNLELNRLQRDAYLQAARLEEQEKSSRGLSVDLTEFRRHYDGAATELAQLREKLRNAEREVRQLAAERDQLRNSVTNWAAAVSVRDERLKEAVAQVRRVGDELNVSVVKFNSLASNHNVVVKDLNDLRSRLSRPPPVTSPPAARIP